MPKQIHLSGFMLFAPAPHMPLSWIYPREKITYQRYETEYWESIARTLERGKFDMLFFADGFAGGIGPDQVRYAIQFPSHDPVSLVTYRRCDAVPLRKRRRGRFSDHPAVLCA